MTNQQIGIDRANRIVEAVKADLARLENRPGDHAAEIAALKAQLVKREAALADLSK